MKQAPVFNCLPFDPFSLFQDRLTSTEVDTGRGEVLQAFVIAPVIVVLDESIDLLSQVAGQVIFFQQDAVLQGLVPALDLALGLRMIRREPPHLNWSTAMFRKRRIKNGKQATEARRDCLEVTTG